LSDYKIEIPDDENTKLHGRSMETNQEKHQSCSNEGAVPEITTEITNKNKKLFLAKKL